MRMDLGDGLRTLAHEVAESWRRSLQSLQSSFQSLQTAFQTPPGRAARSLGGGTITLVRWGDRLRKPLSLLRLATLRRLSALLRLSYYIIPVPPQRLAAAAVSLARVARRATARDVGVVTRARIIANPASGTLRRPTARHELEEAVAYLNAHGLPTEVSLTEHAGHATELAAEAAALGMDIVIAAGGDGTVNEVVQGLAGHETALGVLPLGTVNVWAREVGIPMFTPDACEVILHGARRRVDLGRADDRYFLLMAGIGFDAEVTRQVDQSRSNKIGLRMLEYIATVSRLGVTHRPEQVWLIRNGKRRSTRALMIIIGNTRLYGGAMAFTRHAVADDGLLDVVVIGGGNLGYRLGVIARALLRRSSLGERVRYERTNEIRIESDRPVHVQVDGEVIGTLPMTFAVARNALTVIVPHTIPEPLFERPAL